MGSFGKVHKGIHIPKSIWISIRYVAIRLFLSTFFFGSFFRFRVYEPPYRPLYQLISVLVGHRAGFGRLGSDVLKSGSRSLLSIIATVLPGPVSGARIYHDHVLARCFSAVFPCLAK